MYAFDDVDNERPLISVLFKIIRVFQVMYAIVSTKESYYVEHLSDMCVASSVMYPIDSQSADSILEAV